MKYLLLLIALSFAIFLGLINGAAKEIRDLKAMDKLHSEEIRALRGQIGLCDDKIEWMKVEVRDMVEPFERVIPIEGGYLMMRGENANKN